MNCHQLHTPSIADSLPPMENQAGYDEELQCGSAAASDSDPGPRVGSSQAGSGPLTGSNVAQWTHNIVKDSSSSKGSSTLI